MIEQGREALSAFADDEVDAKERGEVLHRLDDEASRQRLARYFLIGEAMRGQLGSDVRGELSARIAAAIAEPGGGAQRRPQRSAAGSGKVVSLEVAAAQAAPGPQVGQAAGRGVRFGPGALAASVAVAAILGFLGARQMDRTGAGSAPVAQLHPAAPARSAPVAARVAQRWPGRWDVDNPVVRRRLQSYLVDHSEYIGRGVRGMHPYARVVAYAPNPRAAAGRLSGTQ